MTETIKMTEPQTLTAECYECHTTDGLFDMVRKTDNTPVKMCGKCIYQMCDGKELPIDEDEENQGTGCAYCDTIKANPENEYDPPPRNGKCAWCADEEEAEEEDDDDEDEYDWCEVCDDKHHYSERCPYKEECELCEVMLKVDTAIACINRGEDEEMTICQTCWDDNRKQMKAEGWNNPDDTE